MKMANSYGVLVIAVILLAGKRVCAQETGNSHRECSYTLTAPSEEGQCPPLHHMLGCDEHSGETASTGRVTALEEELEALKVAVGVLREELDARKKDCRCEAVNDISTTVSPAPQAFHVMSHEGHYKLTFAEAAAECVKHGARMASYEELYRAWENGLQVCAAGWLTDGSARYPMQTPSGPGCGNRRGIISWGFQDRNNEYDVYCIHC